MPNASGWGVQRCRVAVGASGGGGVASPRARAPWQNGDRNSRLPGNAVLFPQARSATEEDYYTEHLGPTAPALLIHWKRPLPISIIMAPVSYRCHRYLRSSGGTAVCCRSRCLAVRSMPAHGLTMGMNLAWEPNGISTDKFHARGPRGLEELTSYKWVVYGEGQIWSNLRSVCQLQGMKFLLDG